MEEYTLKIELLTDAVFGSGNSVPGFVDADVLHDEYGFLYINGKNFKRKTGRNGIGICKYINGNR